MEMILSYVYGHTERISKPYPREFVQQRLLPIVEKAKGAYKYWIPTRRNMDRTERFGVGEKIDSLFLEALESLRAATYASDEKVAYLTRAVRYIDSLRFFLQIAWENKLIPSKQYETLGTLIEEVGRMTGGWLKGLRAKTPPQGGERRE